MMNRKAGYIRSIERALNDKDLSEIQRQTLVDFDRFNELEIQCRLSTRLNYIRTVVKLGKYLQELGKNYEEASTYKGWTTHCSRLNTCSFTYAYLSLGVSP